MELAVEERGSEERKIGGASYVVFGERNAEKKFDGEGKRKKAVGFWSRT